MKVKLLKPHNHGNVAYNVGDVIDVDAATQEWLANAKVATPISTAPVASPSSSRGRPAPSAVTTETEVSTPTEGDTP